MNIEDFLKETAYVDDMNIGDEVVKVYKSNFDDSYMTHVGMEDEIRFLAVAEITKELTHGVGFSLKENKWYGWSHRAIFGFEIGSKCEKGMCHYVASSPEELIDNHVEFSGEDSRAECQVLPDRSGIRILHTPIKIPMVNMDDIETGLNDIENLPVENLFEDDYSVIKCGRGEWVAETMADAKQMAIDFNEGVS